MNVKPNDVISGSFYLKLISDYKKYDQRQKNLIEKLQKNIELLEWNIEGLKEEIADLEDGSTEKLLQKIDNQRTTLAEYSIKIVKQNKIIEELTDSNQAMRAELKRIKISKSEEVEFVIVDSADNNLLGI